MLLAPYYPGDSQLQVYDIYIIRRVLLAAARDVNILIWTSHKSVDHETNDRVMVHGGYTADVAGLSRCPNWRDLGCRMAEPPEPSNVVQVRPVSGPSHN